MRRLTSPRRRDLTARRTLDPDWPKTEHEDKLEEEDEDDSDSYPGSDSLPVRSKNQISKFLAAKDCATICFVFSV